MRHSKLIFLVGCLSFLIVGRSAFADKKSSFLELRKTYFLKISEAKTAKEAASLIQELNKKYLADLESLRQRAEKNSALRADYNSAFDLYDQVIPVAHLKMDTLDGSKHLTTRECIEAEGIVKASTTNLTQESSLPEVLSKEDQDTLDLIQKICKL